MIRPSGALVKTAQNLPLGRENTNVSPVWGAPVRTRWPLDTGAQLIYCLTLATGGFSGNHQDRYEDRGEATRNTRPFDQKQSASN